MIVGHPHKAPDKVSTKFEIEKLSICANGTIVLNFRFIFAKVKKKMRKYIYIAVASLAVALGFLGMFLPILPTTPFLLLAIWLYMRSSRKGVKMILSNKRLSPYVHSYFSRRGIPLCQLKRILLTLWLTLGVAMAIFHSRILVIAILTAVGIGVTMHLFLKREKTNK